MENENAVEHSKFSQYMAGQFRRTSKKSIALFIGRSVQLLTESLQPFIEPKKLKMETLRFAVIQQPLTDSSGMEVPGWDMVIVARTRAVDANFQKMTAALLSLAQKAGLLTTREAEP